MITFHRIALRPASLTRGGGGNMKSSTLWMCGVIAFAGLVNLPVADAQVRRATGVVRRYQVTQQQQAKHQQAMQKAYLEWAQKSQAAAAAMIAEHRADLARKKAKAEEERQIKSEKTKQHNAEQAAKPRAKTKTSRQPAESDDVSGKADANQEEPKTGNQEASGKDPIDQKKEPTGKIAKSVQANVPVKTKK